ncbi:MAG: addiction module protein [Planctomycetota bacterium]
MVSKATISDVLSLSLAERILLVQDIWDSIANVPEAVELTEAQRQELNARLEAYHRDPTAGSAWDAVKSRISQDK